MRAFYYRGNIPHYPIRPLIKLTSSVPQHAWILVIKVSSKYYTNNAKYIWYYE